VREAFLSGDKTRRRFDKGEEGEALFRCHYAFLAAETSDHVTELRESPRWIAFASLALRLAAKGFLLE